MKYELLEIKLFMLVNKLSIMYDGNMLKVNKFLNETIKHPLNRSNFFEDWVNNRFIKIKMSKETQAILLREAGCTYAFIAKYTRKSPNTIKTIVDNYSLNYSIDADTAKELDHVKLKWREVEGRLNLIGIDIV